jgi:superfamily II DNA/RNA helicase
VAETEHLAYEVPTMEKDRGLVRIIETEMPESAIIFCNTRANANFVAVVLQRFGYDADQLSSDLAQPAREKVLGRLYEHKLRFLVATDVAGRGIDITNLSHVFLRFSRDPESYIHRTSTREAGASRRSRCDPLKHKLSPWPGSSTSRWNSADAERQGRGIIVSQRVTTSGARLSSIDWWWSACSAWSPRPGIGRG